MGPLLLSLTIACGYTSAYVPSGDYRARPTYVGTGVSAHIPDSLPSCGVLEELERPNTPRIERSPLPQDAPEPCCTGQGGISFWVDSAPLWGDSEAVAIVLTVIALLSTSGIAVGLAAAPPEGDARSVLYEVNDYNDAARSKAARCKKKQRKKLPAAVMPTPVLVPPLPMVAGPAAPAAPAAPPTPPAPTTSPAAPGVPGETAPDSKSPQ
jgi:hypothetical protein